MDRHIPLSRGQCAIVDEADYHLVSDTKWHAHPNNKRGEGFYAVNGRGGAKPTIRGRLYMHRVIAGALAHQFVDHIDGDGLNNRRENLRIVNRAQNNINRATPNSTGFRGVHTMPEGNYRAAVCVDRKRIYSGRFASAEDAARAYDALAIVHHGDFARLNFPAAASAA